MARKDLSDREAEFLRQVRGGGTPAKAPPAAAPAPQAGPAKARSIPAMAPNSAPGAAFQASAPVAKPHGTVPSAAPRAATIDPDALLQAARIEAQSGRSRVRRRWIIGLSIVIAILGLWVLVRLAKLAFR